MKYSIIIETYFAQVELNVKNFKTKTDFCCGTCYRKYRARNSGGIKTINK
jgi:hypothetical protein